MGNTILIVEDERDILETVKFRLEANGYQVISAADGEEGLKKARESKPDLIILDLLLPKLDGYKISRLLKFDEKYKDIPIIIFTARVHKDDEALGYETGAEAYIAKPFEPQALLGKIEELLKRDK